MLILLLLSLMRFPSHPKMNIVPRPHHLLSRLSGTVNTGKDETKKKIVTSAQPDVADKKLN